jgi:hypothetical protein
MPVPAAKRVKAMRKRRIYGRRIVPVEVDKDLIDSLVPRFLKPDKRKDNREIGKGLSEWLRVTRQYGGGA